MPKKARRRPLHLAIRGWPRALRLLLAVVFLLLGVLGVILPIFPGWPFLIPGLAILTTLSPRLRRVWHRFLRRHPVLRARIRGIFPRGRSGGR